MTQRLHPSLGALQVSGLDHLAKFAEPCSIVPRRCAARGFRHTDGYSVLLVAPTRSSTITRVPSPRPRVHLPEPPAPQLISEEYRGPQVTAGSARPGDAQATPALFVLIFEKEQDTPTRPLVRLHPQPRLRQGRNRSGRLHKGTQNRGTASFRVNDADRRQGLSPAESPVLRAESGSSQRYRSAARP